MLTQGQEPPRREETRVLLEYTVDFSQVAANPRLGRFVDLISGYKGFNSPGSFNCFCQAVIRCWKEAFPQDLGALRDFNSHLQAIQAGQGQVIKTPWGGVHIVKHHHPLVEKFLVVRRGGYLAFEKHEQKEEQIKVLEGAGILLYREPGAAQLTALALVPGVERSFTPGQEHCVVGTEDLLIFEVSKDHKGMDKDLIFIYTPEA